MCLFFVTGMLSAWDTRQNKCFIHWEGDSAEIGMQVQQNLEKGIGEIQPSMEWMSVNMTNVTQALKFWGGPCEMVEI